MNLETLLIAAALFTLYALALAVLWGLLYTWFPDDVAKWFWPLKERASRYPAVTIANVVLAAVCLTAFWMWPAHRLVSALVGSIASFWATFSLVRSTLL